MSNDLITQLQNSPAAIQPGVDDDTRAVAGAGGNKRISIKGGVFRKVVGGKEVGNIPDRHMEIILVKMAHNPSRTFYTGAYKEGEKVSPTCWSTDSKTPDAGVKTPQSKTCETCPMSVKGSGAGGNGTACRLQWRTAVVLPQYPEGDVMQLVLPATSAFGKEESGKWPFRPYAQMLAARNISAGRIVTKMQFDTNFPVPRVLFSPVRGVSVEDLEIIARQSKSEAAEAAIRLNVFQQDGGDEVAQPVRGVQAATEEQPADIAVPEYVPEPVLREASPSAAAPSDVSSVIKKWSKK